MKSLRKDFFEVLAEFDGITFEWEPVETKLDSEIVRFKPVSLGTEEEFLGYVVMVSFDTQEILVIQTVICNDLFNRETRFENPGKAATFVYGLLASSGFIEDSTEGLKETSEDNNPYGPV